MPACRPIRRWSRRLEGALAEAPGNPPAVPAALARASAARRVLEARLGLRGLQRDQCPVMSVSGWADGYTAAVFDLAENLSRACKGIVGPWGHLYPHRGVPAPAIGFLQRSGALVGSLAEGQAERRARTTRSCGCGSRTACRRARITSTGPADGSPCRIGRRPRSSRKSCRSIPVGSHRRRRRLGRRALLVRRPRASRAASGAPTASARSRRKCRSTSGSTMQDRWSSTPSR